MGQRGLGVLLACISHSPRQCHGHDSESALVEFPGFRHDLEVGRADRPVPRFFLDRLSDGDILASIFTRITMSNRFPLFAFITLLLCNHVFGQNPFSGSYTGQLYLKNDGIVSLPEMGIGAVLVTIDSAGDMRQGLNVGAGPTIGKVTTAGNITFTPALGGQITTGKMVNGKITGSHLADFGALKQTYRVDATKTGEFTGGGGGGSSTPPTINSLTNSQLINPNQAVTLAVSATPATAYQWYLGTKAAGQPIAGATSASYTTPALTAAATYWVKVFNGGAGTDSAEINITVRTGPGGAWEKINLPDPKARIVGAHGSRIAASVRDQASSSYLSEDSGQTWKQVSKTYGFRRAVLSGPSPVFIENASVFVPGAAGEAERATFSAYPGDIGSETILANGSLLLVSSQGDGFFRSADQGKTWQRLNVTGLPGLNAVEFYLGAAGNRVLLGTSTRSAGKLGAIYYSDDEGVSWIKAQGYPTQEWGANQFALVGGQVFARAGSNELYRSDNNGASWSLVKKGPYIAPLTLLDQHFYGPYNKVIQKIATDGTFSEVTTATENFGGSMFTAGTYLVAEIGSFGWYRWKLGQDTTGNSTPTITLGQAPTRNATTGGYEQAISLKNAATALGRFEVEIRGLPANVWVRNASRRIELGGAVEAYVLTFLQQLAAQADLALTLDYGLIGGGAWPSFTPQFTVKTALARNSAQRDIQLLSPTRAAFPFDVIGGKRYRLLRSTNLTSWQTELEFLAAGQLWEWREEMQRHLGYLRLESLD